MSFFNFKTVQAMCWRRAEFKYLGARIRGERRHSMLMSSIQTDREKQKHQYACSSGGMLLANYELRNRGLISRV